MTSESRRKSGGGATVRLTFLGAAKTVTGSKFLLQHENRKVLVDCGLFQGKKELRLRNWEDPPFDPSGLHAIILTHAHIDHTGFLPLLVKCGFKGDIWGTPPTRKLLRLLIPDTAYLQEEEARYANKKGSSRHRPAKPLYTQQDAEKTLRLLRTFERGKTVPVMPGITLRATCAGHILGSTSLTIDLDGKRISFSGDVGRYGTPMLPDPQPLAFGDLLLCESTYGDRLHPHGDVPEELCKAVKKAADRGGPLIIPAFAVGRTQNLLYFLGELERSGRIPVLPVYVDSPMAIDATEIYRTFRHDFDEDATELIEAGKTPLRTERTTFCRTVAESKNLNYLRGPRILISASGMMSGGRILHHLSNWLGHEDTTLLFVGYQAEGTRGQLIQSGAEEIKIFGRQVPVRARIQTISGLSAHADRDELVRWLKSGTGNPSMVKVIHGEEKSSQAFSATLKEEFGWNASVAEYQETVEI